MIKKVRNQVSSDHSMNDRVFAFNPIQASCQFFSFNFYKRNN